MMTLYRQNMSDLPSNADGSPLSLLHMATVNGDKSSIELLLKRSHLDEYRCDVNERDKCGRTALVYAIFSDWYDCAELLLKNGASICSLDCDQRSAFHWAAYLGKEKFIGLLLKYVDTNINWNTSDLDGRTPLHYATAHKNSKCVRLLLRYLPSSMLDITDVEKRTPLHYSVHYGKFDQVKLLRDCGAKVHLRDAKWNSLLHLAVGNVTQDAVKIVKYLLRTNRFYSTQKDCEGRTPLHLAVGRENEVLVKILSMADESALDELDSLSRSPLHYAVLQNNVNIVTILITNGASLYKEDGVGATPLHYVAKNNAVLVLECLLSLKKVVDATDKEGRTAMMWAASAGAKDVLELMLKTPQSFDINAGDHKGMTALHYACLAGHLAGVMLLIANSANIRQPDKSGQTALFKACRQGHINVADFLINNELFYLGSFINSSKGVTIVDPRGQNPASGELNQTFEEESKSERDVTPSNGHGGRVITQLKHQGNNKISTAEGRLAMNRKEFIRTLDDVNGCTPLHFAANSGHGDVCAWLLKNGVDPQKRDSGGRTALHGAAYNGHIICMGLMLELCPGLNNDRDLDGYSVLHRAAINGHLEAVKMLVLEHNAFPNFRVKSSNLTPLDLAMGADQQDVTQFLIDHGGLTIAGVQEVASDTIKRYFREWSIRKQKTTLKPLIEKHMLLTGELRKSTKFEVVSEPGEPTAPRQLDHGKVVDQIVPRNQVNSQKLSTVTEEQVVEKVNENAKNYSQKGEENGLVVEQTIPRGHVDTQKLSAIKEEQVVEKVNENAKSYSQKGEGDGLVVEQTIPCGHVDTQKLSAIKEEQVVEKVNENAKSYSQKGEGGGLVVEQTIPCGHVETQKLSALKEEQVVEKVNGNTKSYSQNGLLYGSLHHQSITRDHINDQKISANTEQQSVGNVKKGIFHQNGDAHGVRIQRLSDDAFEQSVYNVNENVARYTTRDVNRSVVDENVTCDRSQRLVTAKENVVEENENVKSYPQSVETPKIEEPSKDITASDISGDKGCGNVDSVVENGTNRTITPQPGAVGDSCCENREESNSVKADTSASQTTASYTTERSTIDENGPNELITGKKLSKKHESSIPVDINVSSESNCSTEVRGCTFPGDICQESVGDKNDGSINTCVPDIERICHTTGQMDFVADNVSDKNITSSLTDNTNAEKTRDSDEEHRVTDVSQGSNSGPPTLHFDVDKVNSADKNNNKTLLNEKSTNVVGKTDIKDGGLLNIDFRTSSSDECYNISQQSHSEVSILGIGEQDNIGHENEPCFKDKQANFGPENIDKNKEHTTNDDRNKSGHDNESCENVDFHCNSSGKTHEIACDVSEASPRNSKDKNVDDSACKKAENTPFKRLKSELDFDGNKDTKHEIDSAVDEKGRTLLHFAAECGDPVQCSRLIEKGAIVDKADRDGRTPIHYAALNASIECARTLLACNPRSGNIRDSSGQTPLHLAAATGHLELVKLLLSTYSASQELRHTATPLDLALTGSHRHIVEYLTTNGVRTRSRLEESACVIKTAWKRRKQNEAKLQANQRARVINSIEGCVPDKGSGAYQHIPTPPSDPGGTRSKHVGRRVVNNNALSCDKGRVDRLQGYWGRVEAVRRSMAASVIIQRAFRRYLSRTGWKSTQEHRPISQNGVITVRAAGPRIKPAPKSTRRKTEPPEFSSSPSRFPPVNNTTSISDDNSTFDYFDMHAGNTGWGTRESVERWLHKGTIGDSRLPTNRRGTRSENLMPRKDVDEYLRSQSLPCGNETISTRMTRSRSCRAPGGRRVLSGVHRQRCLSREAEIRSVYASPAAVSYNFAVETYRPLTSRRVCRKTASSLKSGTRTHPGSVRREVNGWVSNTSTKTIPPSSR